MVVDNNFSVVDHEAVAAGRQACPGERSGKQCMRGAHPECCIVLLVLIRRSRFTISATYLER